MRSAFVSDASRNWAHNVDDLFERWVLRYEIEVTSDEILHMSAGEFSKYLTEVDKPALVDLHAELTVIINAIKQQQHECHARGRKIPGNKVKRICQSYSQMIQAEQARRNKNRKNSFPSLFVRVCEEVLAPELFDEIKDRTYKLQEAANNGD